MNQEDNHLHMLVLLGAGSAESLVAFDSSEDILDLSRDAMVSLSDWGAGGPGFYSRVLQCDGGGVHRSSGDHVKKRTSIFKEKSCMHAKDPQRR